jgi:beta-glucanase (GH16 family)
LGESRAETYTKDRENAHLDGKGNFVIHVAKAGSGYTSARLKTLGLFATKYGRVEARIKIPSGQGIWPAFWLLGADINSVGWPQCGEIDVMENIGREPSIIHGTIHGPDYSGGKGPTASYSLPGGQRFADRFHVFTVVWTENSVEFLVDSHSYHKVTPAQIPNGAKWVFGHPFFLLLKVAVGGDWSGSPDTTTVFPQDMLVDYVRVYEAAQ